MSVPDSIDQANKIVAGFFSTLMNTLIGYEAKPLSEEWKLFHGVWDRWLIELFCDAAALEMCGPAFLYTTANYLMGLDRRHFYKPLNDHHHIEHPWNGLRVRFLVNRIRSKTTWDDIAASAANDIEERLTVIQEQVGVKENSHGYYSDELERDLVDVIDQLLRLSNLVQCKDSETSGSDLVRKEKRTVVRILNAAWGHFNRNSPNLSDDWDRSMRDSLLTALR